MKTRAQEGHLSNVLCAYASRQSVRSPDIRQSVTDSPQIRLDRPVKNKKLLSAWLCRMQPLWQVL
jgi:hypothetical protein